MVKYRIPIMNKKSIINKIYILLLILILSTGFLIKAQQQIFSSNEYVKTNLYSQELTLEKQVIQTSLANDQLNDQMYIYISSKEVDEEKVRRVREYLKKRNAPLAREAEFFVQTANEFGLDFRLVASISVIESNGGKYAYRPYNAWGWGGQGRAFTFKSWKEGIYTVSKGLSYYKQAGLDTPEEIGRRYNPESHREWSRKVSFVMSQM